MASANDTYISNLDGNDIKRYFGELSLTNQYQVNIQGLSDQLMGHLGAYYNFNVLDDIGILCTDANLPTSSFATSEVKDNFIGVTQEFAHTRLYTDLDFTFYVDTDYDTLRFFEGWMDFISGGNLKNEPAANSTPNGNVYRRFNYPKYYKTSGLYIVKFERGVASNLRSRATERNYRLKYQFINAFPKAVSAMPISYGPADLLKVNVTFNFDRYITTRDETTPVIPSSGQVAATLAARRSTVKTEPTVQERPLEPTNAEELSPAQLQQKAFEASIAAGRSNRNRNTTVRGPRER